MKEIDREIFKFKKQYDSIYNPSIPANETYTADGIRIVNSLAELSEDEFAAFRRALDLIKEQGEEE